MMNAAMEAALPLITGRSLIKVSPLQKPVQAWLGSLNQIEDVKMGLLDLHPSIFSVNPRLDILFRNVHWQNLYGKIDYRWAPTRAERPGRNKKPWQQKGLGKARHASRLSPQWMGGGVAHGPRGPKSFFFMESFAQRVLGLRTALTVKLHQNDLFFVETLDIPKNDPKYLKDLIDARYWGPSVLFVDNGDIAPYNLTAAVNGIRGCTIMPTYGLNVYSMLKHNTLVLSKQALDTIEERIVFHMNNCEIRNSELNKNFN